jgi:lipopolysaccharide transport system ATP-binding protein
LDALVSGQPVLIRISFVNKSNKLLKDVSCGISFFTSSGVHLCGCRARAVGVTMVVHPSNGYTECFVPRWPLSAGRYSYHLYAEQGGNRSLDWVQDAGTVQIESGDYFGTGFLPAVGRESVYIDYKWKVRRTSRDQQV